MDNLRWAAKSQQSIKCPGVRAIEAFDPETGHVSGQWPTMKAAGLELGVYANHIKLVLKGTSYKTAKGIGFRYV